MDDSLRDPAASDQIFKDPSTRDVIAYGDDEAKCANVVPVELRGGVNLEAGEIGDSRLIIDDHRGFQSGGARSFDSNPRVTARAVKNKWGFDGFVRIHSGSDSSDIALVSAGRTRLQF